MAAEVERIRSIAEAARVADARRLGRAPVRALLQRVTRAEVRVDGRVVGSIGPGLLVLLGVGPRRRRGDRRRARAPDLRAADLRGRRGTDEPVAAGHRRRGCWSSASSRSTRTRAGAAGPGSRTPPPPELAKGLWLRVAAGLEAPGVRTALGEFGASMEVELVNDGPFTIWLDTGPP